MSGISLLHEAESREKEGRSLRPSTWWSPADFKDSTVSQSSCVLQGSCVRAGHSYAFMRRKATRYIGATEHSEIRPKQALGGTSMALKLSRVTAPSSLVGAQSSLHTAATCWMKAAVPRVSPGKLAASHLQGTHGHPLSWHFAYCSETVLLELSVSASSAVPGRGRFHQSPAHAEGKENGKLGRK